MKQIYKFIFKSFKVKLLVFLLAIISFAVTSLLVISLNHFKQDKTSYIYENVLSRSENLSKLTEEKLTGVANSNYNYAFTSKRNPQIVQSLVNFDSDLLAFVIIEDKNEKIEIKAQFLNSNLSESFKVSEEIIEKELRTQKFKKKKFSIIPMVGVGKLNTLAVCTRNELNDEIYISVLVLDSILDKYKSDTLFENELVNSDGLSFITFEKVDIPNFSKFRAHKGASEIEIRGEPNLVGFSPISEFNLSAITKARHRTAFSALENVKNDGTALGIFLFSICAMIGLFFGDTISKPILRLVSMAKEIINGNFGVQVNKLSSDEIGILGSTFNFMSSKISNTIEELKEANAQLEDYSKNLEVKVEERTKDLKEANDRIDTMVNSLDQGMLVFNEDASIEPGYTLACESIFETSLEDKSLLDIMFFEEEKDLMMFKTWIDTAFKGMIPFNSLLDLAPKEIQKKDGDNIKYIAIEFNPINETDVDDPSKETLKQIVMVATDITAEKVAQIQFEKQQAEARVITKIVKDKFNFIKFKNELEGYLDRMKKSLSTGEIEDMTLLKRDIHTIKGGLGIYSVTKSYEALNDLEDDIDANIENPDAIEVSRINDVIEAVELEFRELIEKNKDVLGKDVVEGRQVLNIDIEESKEFSHKLKTMELEDLRYDFNNIFYYVDLKDYFITYEELIDVLATRLAKKVHPVSYITQSFKIPPNIYDDFFASLVHVFRNIMDHGIEEPELRVNRGKEELGNIAIGFNRDHQKGFITISISDDGGGIDVARIREVAKTRQVNVDVDNISDQEVLELIFDEGFSTQKSASDLSGRGIGLNVVKYEVEKLGGKIEINTKLEAGTHFQFTLPLKD